MECIICQDTIVGELAEYKRSDQFGCVCEVYFCDECWIKFAEYEMKCPLCREQILPEVKLDIENEEDEPLTEGGIACYFIFHQYCLIMFGIYVCAFSEVMRFYREEIESLYLSIAGLICVSIVYVLIILKNFCGFQLRRWVFMLGTFYSFVFFIHGNVALFSGRIHGVFLQLAIFAWLPIGYCLCVVQTAKYIYNNFLRS